MTTGIDTIESPAVAHIIERPRLIQILEQADARVVLLAAPAGYGKTTLAQQWANRQTTPVAWYRATRASADVATLAVGLDEALSAIDGSRPASRGHLEAIAAANPSSRPLASALIRRYSKLPPTTLLIVDDWESAVSEDAEQLLRILVQALSIRFMITTRSRPPWLSRLVIYGEAREVTRDDLALTEAEVRAVFAGIRQDDAVLPDYADGWPAVVGLAALSAAGRHDQAGLGKKLHDYLESELLGPAPENVRRAVFLIAAASIQHERVAKLVLGAGCETLLQEASDRGLLVASEEPLGAIAVHPLVANLVARRLMRAVPTELGVLKGALPVLQARGCWEECLAAAENLHDGALAMEVIHLAAADLLRTGRIATLRRLIVLARSSHCEDPYLDYAEGAVALRTGNLALAFSLGRSAVQGLEADDSARAHLLAARAAHLIDRDSSAEEHFRAAQSAQAGALRDAALWGLTIRAIEEQLPDAHAALSTFKNACAPTLENRLRAIEGDLWLGQLEGGLLQRIEDAEEAFALLPRVTEPMAATSFLNAYGYILCLTADYAHALEAAELQLVRINEANLDFALPHALHLRAASLVGLRRFGLAQRALGGIQRSLRSTPDRFLEANLRMQQARIYLSTGSPERARDILAVDLEGRHAKSTVGEYLALRAIALAASGEATDAAYAARRARETSSFLAVHALTSMALGLTAFSRRRPDKTAIRHMVRALRTQTFDAIVVGLRAMPKVVHQLDMDRDSRDVLRTILRRSNDVGLAAQIGLRIPRDARRTGTLSPREAEIHELIAQGLTNRAIANALFISESTTKVHVQHIFDKLGVRSRIEAARLWPELGGGESS